MTGPMGRLMVRYGEIALKGKNRRDFEARLQRNLAAAARPYGGEISREHARFFVTAPGDNLEALANRLARVFGVVSLSPVLECDLNLEEIKDVALALTATCARGQASFAVAARRANKRFPHTSPELNRILGRHLQETYPHLQVDLTNPDFTIFVEIGQRKAHLYGEKLAGPGGLPLGITGRALLLLSGGIDSPVAGWLAMKRGLYIEALHCHSYPLTSSRSREKAVDLARALARYSGKMTLHNVSVTAIQKALRLQCPENLAIILLRRMMLRLAEAACTQRNLEALVTGENLGQVASQTLESMTVISRVTSLPLLRPLVTMDKHEIVSRASEIGTYEISIRPYEDCCTLFVPPSPVTKPREEVVIRAEEALNIPSLIEEALSSLETTILLGNGTGPGAA